MKAYTSRNTFDERDRFTGVREQMGQVRLDSEANLQVDIVRGDARRRSGDLVEGSPDDGFRITDTHLLDPVLSLDGLERRGPGGRRRAGRSPRSCGSSAAIPTPCPTCCAPAGHTAVTRRMPGVDLLRLPVPLHPEGATYAAASVVVQVRFDRPPTDDEVVDVRVVVLDSDGDEHDVGAAPAPEAPDAVQASAPWISVTVPIADLAPLRRGSGADETLVLAGWGLRGLPPRATVDVDALLAVDSGLRRGRPRRARRGRHGDRCRPALRARPADLPRARLALLPAARPAGPRATGTADPRPRRVGRPPPGLRRPVRGRRPRLPGPADPRDPPWAARRQRSGPARSPRSAPCRCRRAAPSGCCRRPVTGG